MWRYTDIRKKWVVLSLPTQQIYNTGCIETSLVLVDWLIDYWSIVKFWNFPGGSHFAIFCMPRRLFSLTWDPSDGHTSWSVSKTYRLSVHYISDIYELSPRKTIQKSLDFHLDISKRSVKIKKTKESHGPHSSHEQDFKLHLQLVPSIYEPFSNSGVRVFEKKYAKKILSYPNSWLACMYM